MTTLLATGTRVRDLYEHSETHTIARKTKAQRDADVCYFGSQDKADQWYRVRSDVSGKIAIMHRDMLSICN